MSAATVSELELLRACLKFLERRGFSGEVAWRHGKAVEGKIVKERLKAITGEDNAERAMERARALHARELQLIARTALDARIVYLKDIVKHFEQFRGEEHKYLWLPVDMRTFVESAEMLNYEESIYPEVMKALIEANSGKYVEAVWTGGIGTGKTTSALLSQVYQTYLLCCLKTPQAEFGLDPSSEILIVFQSMTKTLSKTLDYGRFKGMIEASPFFQSVCPPLKVNTDEMEFRSHIKVKPLSGSHHAAIGQNIFSALIDEINFMQKTEKSKMAADGGTFDQGMEIYNAIVRRRKSRFMAVGGKLPGLLCVVSSKVRPDDFTSRKEREAKTDKTIYVYDKRIWEVKPWAFDENWFKVFVGDVSRKPRILEEDDVDSEDLHLILDVPEAYRSEFERDLLTALRDIGGMATQALHPFIMANDKIAACFGKVPSIISREDVDFVGTKLQIYPKRFFRPDEPRFGHLDLSLSNDSTGLAVGFIERFERVQRDANWWEILPVIRYDLLLEVKPPRNAEIEFSKIRSLLYRLREMGLNLKWFSFDTYQSADSVQILRQQGFQTGLTSMDTETLPYETFKTAILDGRILAPEHARAQTEVTRLEFDPDIGKVDHPPDGSKDVADAMAGVCYGLTYRRELWARHKVPMTQIPASLSSRMAKEDRAAEKETRKIQQMVRIA